MMGLAARPDTLDNRPDGASNRSTAMRARFGQLVYLLVLPMLVIAAAVGLVLLVASMAGMLAYYWAEQILLAGGVALISAFAGSLVVAVTWRICPAYLPEGLLAAIGTRLLVTLGGIGILAFCLTHVGKMFFLGVAGFYIVGLISETILAITLVRQGYMDQSQKKETSESHMATSH